MRILTHPVLNEFPVDAFILWLDHASTTPAVENSTPPELALGGGYPESKWIAEQLFLRASKETGLRAISVRVGQISGDHAVGGWGTRECVPTLVRTSQRLGCLPSRNEVRVSCGDVACESYLTPFLFVGYQLVSRQRCRYSSSRNGFL